ncbi:MAG: sigma-70 family RNA polymerase sigma factor [bacterium]
MSDIHDVKLYNVLIKKKEFEEHAFEHLNSLYNTALRMTKNELDAEDLVQDVFLRAFRFFHKFDQGTNFKAWIFKILTNTYINQYRKKSREPLKVDFEKVNYTYSEDGSDNYDQQLEKFDESNYVGLFDDEIKAALSQLPDEFRMVVLLADIEDFSYKEIAEMVGCPIGTVMSRLSRGRRQLQIHLRDYAIKNGFINKSNHGLTKEN